MTEDQFDAYQSLAEESEDHRWAFGTGFTDPLEGVDTSVPDGVDAAALAAYCLMLADDALVYSHRLQQWMTRLPELEEETALANIALDLLGQARMLLARAGRAEGCGRGEDQLAFFREEGEFRNVRLVEALDADFAELAGRLLVFSAWRLALFSRAGRLGGPGARGHRGQGCQGTRLSPRLRRAVGDQARRRDHAVARQDAGRARRHVAAGGGAVPARPGGGRAARRGGRPAALRAEFDAVLDAVLAEATLDRPPATPVALVDGRGGRDGVHTEAFGYLLAELQSLARAHPDATW